MPCRDALRAYFTRTARPRLRAPREKNILDDAKPKSSNASLIGAGGFPACQTFG
jgi:hypothetical protein